MLIIFMINTHQLQHNYFRPENGLTNKVSSL